jgi:hypothetical protein
MATPLQVKQDGISIPLNREKQQILLKQKTKITDKHDKIVHFVIIKEK